MMEGSGARSVLVTNGSGCGSGRPKDIRIRIPNTHCHQVNNEPRHLCFRDKKFKEELEKYKKTDAAV
jgi:hypothetical protein